MLNLTHPKKDDNDTQGVDLINSPLQDQRGREQPPLPALLHGWICLQERWQTLSQVHYVSWP